MKKIYTILVLMLIASFSFAQVINQIPVRSDNMIGIKKAFNHNNAAKAGAGSWWFGYGDGLQQQMPDFEFETGAALMLQDSVAIVHYTDGDGRPQFYSFAQAFDFTSSEWTYFYENLFDEETGNTIPVPSLSGTTTYTIDSMACTFGYLRGDSVSADVVDTLIMTIAANQDELEYMNISSGGSPWWLMAEINYDINNATIKNDYPLFYQYKLPLTANDDTSDPENEGYYYFVTFSVPVEGFENITTKNVVVSYSFKSASQRDLNTVYGVQTNSMRGFYLEDPREGYDVNGSEVLLNNTNTSLCAMEWSVSDPTFLFYEKYVTNSVWNGLLKRPDIYVHATCDDCAWVNVEEMAKREMTVRPNPATSAFTVELAEDANANVQLFNLVGQEVYSSKVNTSSVTINVENYNPGIYMLRVSQNGNVYTSKVIVK